MTTKQKLDISCTPLLDIFSVLPDQHQPEKPPVNDPVPKQQRRFIAPQPSDLMFANSCLHQHLEQAGQKIPIIVADFLNDLDWSAFESQYATTGRPPYAPRNMAGLILFGIMQGITSLRGLETLARLNLGCMWVSGVYSRIMPILAGLLLCMPKMHCGKPCSTRQQKRYSK